MTAVAILAMLVADLHQNTGTSFAASNMQRDLLKAEYLARSGINLTRMLVAQEPAIRKTVSPIYQAMLKSKPPQINVWQYADIVLKPFSDYDGARSYLEGDGYDLGLTEGLGDTGGIFEVVAVAENGKININKPLFLDGDPARISMADQLYSLMGGLQSPSKYDPLFNTLDEDGQLTTRLDVISNLIDWWDYDQYRTDYDPGAHEVATSPGEDDAFYQARKPSYQVKNAPFDTLEELRLVRGVSDDFWATFIEPDSDDPRSRTLTIYGSGSVNPNEATAAALLARVCPAAPSEPLCAVPEESMKFIMLLETARGMAPVPFFEKSSAFLKFMQGEGQIFTMLKGFLGEDSPLLFTPIKIEDADTRRNLMRRIITKASILTVQSTGTVNRARVRLRTVINFDDKWTAPKPYGGGPTTGLGIMQYFRLD